MKKHIYSIIAIFLALAFTLCGCDFIVKLLPSSTPVSTALPTPAPTPTTKPEPSSTPAKIYDFLQIAEEERQQILDTIMVNVQAYLNCDSPYTKEFLQSQTLGSAYSSPKQSHAKLGLMANISNGLLFIQGVLLGIYEKSGGLMMVMGFLDEDEARFVTVVEIDLDFYRIAEKCEYRFGILAYNGVPGEGKGGDSIVIKGISEEFFKHLALFLYKPIIIMLNCNNFNEYASRGSQVWITDYQKKNAGKLVYTAKLVNILYKKGVSSLTGEQMAGIDDVGLVTINTAEDLMSVDRLKIPTINGIHIPKAYVTRN